MHADKNNCSNYLESLSLVILLGTGFHSYNASAQCAPDPVANGGTVSCTGVDPDGFITASDTVTVDVQIGASIDTAGSIAVGLLGVDSTLNNAGSITTAAALNGAGIAVGGTNSVIHFTSTGSAVTTGQEANGIAILGAGATIILDPGSSLTTSGVTGLDTIAINAPNADVFANGDVMTSEPDSYGVISSGQSNISVTVGATGSITTTGDDSRGIGIAGSNATITVNGSVMTSGNDTTGESSHAITMGHSAMPTIGGELTVGPTGVVSTSGDGSFAVVAAGSGPIVNIAQGGEVSATGGLGAFSGMPATGLGSVAISGVVNNAGTVSANPGSDSVGAIVGGDGSVFNNQTTGTINGGGALGGTTAVIFFTGGGDSVTFNNEGLVAGGIDNPAGSGLAEGDETINNIAAGIINGDVSLGPGDDTFLQSGTGALNGELSTGEGDDNVTWTSGSAENISGENGTDGVTISALSFDGSQILDGGDDTASADGWIDTLRLQNLTVALTGATTPNWENIIIDGTALSSADNMLTTGSDPGTGLSLINGASLSLEDGMAGDTFTLTGNYIGSGQLFLDATLGDSGSVTDSFSISGNASGTSTINIANVGGLGDATTGNGILIVEVLGASDPGAFVLAGGEILSGDYLYRLIQVGGQNWFLQSNSSLAAAPAIGVPTMSKFALVLLALSLGLLTLTQLSRRQV